MGRTRKYFKNQRIRKDYYNYYDVCTMEGISKDRANKAVWGKGVEGIKSLEELKPIEDLFVVFEKPSKGKMNHTYAILRRYYDEWKMTGEPPKLPTGAPRKEGYVFVKYSIPETLREEFNAVIEKANSMSVIQVKHSDMAALAIREFIDRRPEFQPEED